MIEGGIIVRAGIVCGLLAVSGSAQAQTAYVTDRLQLGVHQLADTSDRSFATLKSGERVEISEESQYHARVTIADGRTGWVKKNYLVADKPAILRLTEVEQERDRAIDRLESLTSGFTDREAQLSEIEAAVIARETAAAADADELKLLRIENVKLADRLEAYAFSVPGKVFFAAAGTTLVIGFLFSWWWFDHRSRVRHGGYRVH